MTDDDNKKGESLEEIVSEVADDIENTPKGETAENASIDDIVKSVEERVEKKDAADVSAETPLRQGSAGQACPKCGSPLGEVVTTKTGRKLQRCTAGSWDPETKKTVGCDYVKWLEVEPEQLSQQCPKCGSPLLMVVTRFGKKMKKCSTNTWNAKEKKAEGCDYVEWISGTTEKLDEECPTCSAPLVLYTTAAGKRMKKCSTAGWDKEKRKPTGCTYVQWLKPGEYEKVDSGGEEFLPPEPPED